MTRAAQTRSSRRKEAPSSSEESRQSLLTSAATKLAEHLPPGWLQVPIGDVTIPKVEQREPTGKGDFCYVDIGSVDNLAKVIVEPKSIPVAKAPSRARQLIHNGDVLASMTRPNLNAVALVPKKLDGAIASTGFDVLRSNGAVLPEWLFLLVRSKGFVDAMTDLVQGALYPAVRPADIRDFQFPLPPLAEQRRIVERLEKLAARSRRARAALDAVPQLLAQARQSLLAAAFRGDLTKDWRKINGAGESAANFLETIQKLRKLAWEKRTAGRPNRKYPEPVEGKFTDVPSIHPSWRWTSADAICSQVTDGEHIQPPYQSAGLPMLSAKHVHDGFVDAAGAGLISEKHFKTALARCRPENGDVLIVSVGATTGRAAIVQNCPPFVIVRSVLLLKPLVPGEYLLRWLQSPWCFHWMTQASGASAQAHLYINDTKELPVPIPPLAEQKEIVRRVSRALCRLDSSVAAHASAVAELDRLDQSLLARAFTGQLVPQNPHDEPAEKLLARIRAERENP